MGRVSFGGRSEWHLSLDDCGGETHTVEPTIDEGHYDLHNKIELRKHVKIKN